jgi:arabinose-5-phosphate isomerase
VLLVEGCTGSVVVTGIGKAGLVARKISATLASTGTPSHFLHPAEALHGDLGALRRDDVMLALSQSGETEEVTRLLPHVKARMIRLVALTSRPDSTLGRAADVVVTTGSVREACALGLAPSTSTSLMLALGDALALATSGLRGFTAEDFAARHPGGTLGRQLMLVEEAMRPLEQCRVARPEDTVRAVFTQALPARRTGAVMIVASDGRLAGIFTDSDLARIFERRDDAALDAPIAAVMTPRPTTILAGARLGDALALLESRRLSELPVVDPDDRPYGLLDIVDLVGLAPAAAAAERPGSAAA